MPSQSELDVISIDSPTASVGGCYQISLGTRPDNRKRDPLPALVNYRLPSGIKRQSKGFATADGTLASRTFVSEPGHWTWEAKTGFGQAAISGEFEALPSTLPGKLSVSRSDSRQFKYDNGKPFLHFGDTAYTLLSSPGESWKAYIDQAAQAGFNKVKVWLADREDSLDALYDPLRQELNLSYWDQAEERLGYACARHPSMQIQINLFAKDREELGRYEEGDPLTHLAVLYAIERLGSFPSVQWSLATAIDPGSDSAHILQAISRLGNTIREQSPTPTLITCGQPRYSPFLFDRERWCSMSSLGSLGQVTGEIARENAGLTSKPIVVEEDRAEHQYAPLRPRYYFRRLFWGLLLSGAHPTYEGLDTKRSAGKHKTGIHGYYDACHASRLQAGAHDLLHIKKFFTELQLDLEGWRPDDAISGNNPLLVKAMRSPQNDKVILYVANPDSHKEHSGSRGEGFYSDQNATANDVFTTFNMELPFNQGAGKWFNPSTGEWHGEVTISKSSSTFLTPEPGDWVFWATRA